MKLTLRAVIAIVFCGAVISPASAQIFKTLFSFDNATGSNPPGPLAQGVSGALYGTTSGELFRLSGGTVVDVFDFDGLNTRGEYGEDPQAPPTLGDDGNFYGSCANFGPISTYGSLFKVTPAGVITNLHGFGDEDGAGPNSLVLGNDGNLYGTTYAGGPGAGIMLGFYGYGTIFKITPGGTFTNLYNFTNTDYSTVEPSVLTPGNDGNFYGTTLSGGPNALGTVFKITPDGTFTNLYTFDATIGSAPGPLTLGNDGNFYGVTGFGGAANMGMIFKITPQGAFTGLYSFSPPDGNGIESALTLGSDGNFYGTTYQGGADNDGTLFKVTPDGTFTSLHSFQGLTDGMNPMNGLTQDTNGTFYGTAYSGGANDYGTIFSLNVGLPSFVRLQTFEGKAGRSIGILGQGFTAATTVSFNGTAAVARVISSGYLAATVPSGATTGKVTVTTGAGTLISNREFIVVE